jgi:hypothetical protein
VKELPARDHLNDAHIKADADVPISSGQTIRVTVASMPVMSKAEALAMVRSNRMPFSSHDVRVECAEVRDSAVVTGRLLRERSINGKTITDNWRFN